MYISGVAGALLVLLVASYSTLSAPQTKLQVTVYGDEEALNATLHLVYRLDDKYRVVACELSGGSCEVDVEAASLKVVAAWFDDRIAVVRVRGVNEVAWRGEWRNLLRLTVEKGRIMAYMSVSPAAEGGTLRLEVEARRACVLALDSRLVEGLYMPSWVKWWLGLSEEDGRYYLVVPEGSSLTLPLRADPSSEFGRLLDRLTAYGVIGRWRRGIEIPCVVRCEDGNTSLAYLVARSLRGRLEEYVARERELLSRVGFSADRYLEDVGYAIWLLRESEKALGRGDFEVGWALLSKGLTRAAVALEALSQAKTDSVAMFLILLTFTFFLSSIISNIVERRRGLVNALLFTCLALLELAFIPQARMALAFLSPEVLQRASPTAMTLSLITAVLTILLVAMTALSAKGTLLSDLFWYSVKSMRRRKLRAILTIVTIAVVASVSSAFIAVGSRTVVREASYPSRFRGLSVSLHVTTVTYIFRGLDQANEVIVREHYGALTPPEVKWLAGMSWVKRIYVAEVGRAPVEHGGARALATVVATNASELGGIAVSESLAQRLGVEEGDVIKVAGRRVRVVEVFNDSSPPALLDGVPLDEVGGPLVVGGLELAPPGSAVYRVILEGDVGMGVAEDLIRMSFEESLERVPSTEAQITVQTFKSYRACVGGGSGTKCLLIVGIFQQASGTPEFVVVVGLASLTVAVSLLGSIYERRREYSTMSALGASPGHVSLLLLVEGLSYGIIGGVAGYVAGQFLLASTPSRATPLRPQAFSPLLTSLLVAIVPSVIGSLVPARKAALQVVPSRLLLRRASEVRILKDRAEAEIPLRIVGDEEEFVEYVKSLVRRPSPVGWGPLYMRVEAHERGRRVEYIDVLVSFRGERAAVFLVKLFLPRSPGEAIRAVALSPTGKWTVDHRSCAKGLLTALRDDLLHYIEWKKKRRREAL